jgi:short-subunit dehydrogenase
MARTVVITGASSGLGEALALDYAKEHARLGLLARNLARLDSVAQRSRSAGAAAVAVGAVDVRARTEMARWLSDFDDDSPVDILIANAGIMEGSPAAGEIEPPDAAHALMETNVLGVLNTVQPIVTRMMARGSGQIAIVSSIAAFVPLADAPSYSASKAAMLNYGLALRSLLSPHGIKVSVVCPGYVSTPMMRQESGPKPFAMAPQRAASLIRRGLARDRPVIAFPAAFALITRLGGLLPDRLRRWTSEPFRFTVSRHSGIDQDA